MLKYPLSSWVNRRDSDRTGDCGGTGEQGLPQTVGLSTTVRIGSSQDNREEGERRGHGLRR